jgi:hypothetical protein
MSFFDYITAEDGKIIFYKGGTLIDEIAVG